MKIVKVTYGMLRVTKPYENDRVEVEIELGHDDSFEDAVKEAKRLCTGALNGFAPVERRQTSRTKCGLGGCKLPMNHRGSHAANCGCINGCAAWECPNV